MVIATIKDKEERYSKLYDLICDYLDEEFIVRNVCGFKNNQCYMQRKLKNNEVNGCCRMCIHQNRGQSCMLHIARN